MVKMCEYKVKGKRVYVGIDVSKRKYSVHVRSGGMMIDQLSIPADYEVLLRYIRNNYPECDIRVMYEAGFSGFGLHDYLSGEGIRCIVTPPGSVMVEKVDKKKNDKHDAARLCRNLEKGDYKACEVPDKERREDRLISRTLEQVQNDITRVKNRIRRFFDYNDLNGGNTSEEWRASDWVSARRESEREGPLGESLEVNFSLLETLLEKRRQLRRRLIELSRKERYKKAVEILSSVPGVGVLTAIRMVLEWGEDWSRFKSSSAVASYSGLISSEYSTGDDHRRGHITGQSRGAVRALLIQCAWTAIRHDPALRWKYMKVWKRSGSKKKAIVAVARKMVVRMRAIMLSGEKYKVGLMEERKERKVKRVKVVNSSLDPSINLGTAS